MLERLVQRPDAVVAAAVTLERNAQVIPRTRVVGRQPHGFPQRVGGLAVPPATTQRASQSDVHARVLRAVTRGFAIRAYRVGRAAGTIESDGEAQVRTRVGGRGAQRVAKGGGRVV